MDEKLCNERYKHHQEKLEEHEKRIESLEKTYFIMQKMDYRIGRVESSIEKINEKLDKSKEEKGTKWDKLIDYLFYSILAIMLGYIATNLGIKWGVIKREKDSNNSRRCISCF